jgi:hypothetical protein
VNQPSLFSDVKTDQSAGAEFDYRQVVRSGFRYELGKAHAEARREVGVARTEATSARIDPFFESVAVEAVRSFALGHREFLTENVRDVCPTPSGLTGRVWGSIMRKAHKLGYVHPAGFGQANSSNRGPKVLWRSLLFQAVDEAT